jgi:hypothetical protein
MRAVLGCSKTYAALFAEQGLEHVHFHVVLRIPDMDQGPHGRRVFGHLGRDPASHVSAKVMDQAAVSVGQAERLDT